jgi:FHS family L-fucose permease-like MFS transporter
VFDDMPDPRFKAAFQLNYFEAMMVQFAFFGTYFVGTFIYFIISATTGDPIAKLGYQNGVVIGWLIAATGSALFWPAANAISSPMFLAALFIVGLGFALLQIAANPYVTILGPEKTASSRLNLAAGWTLKWGGCKNRDGVWPEMNIFDEWGTIPGWLTAGARPTVLFLESSPAGAF